MTTKVYIGLLGGGAQSREVMDYAQELGMEIVFVAVDPKYLDHVGSVKAIDITTPTAEDLQTPVLVAVGAPALKRQFVSTWPGKKFASLIAQQAWVSASAKIGSGSIVAPLAAVAAGVQIAQHVLINLGATISHDVEVGEYATISPGVHIGGRVQLGRGVFVGLGASIKNDVKVAEGVVIGAGATIVEDIAQSNAIVVGSPGKVRRTNDGWLDEV